MNLFGILLLLMGGKKCLTLILLKMAKESKKSPATTGSYEEYTALYKKFTDGTATESERKRLLVLAFGEEYLKSEDKGTVKFY